MSHLSLPGQITTAAQLRTTDVYFLVATIQNLSVCRKGSPRDSEVGGAPHPFQWTLPSVFGLRL